MACYNVVHVVILTQVELQQIDFHFTVLNKHAMLNHLGEKEGDIWKSCQHIQYYNTAPFLRHYLPDDGSLAFQTAIPADKLIPRLSGH